MLSIYLIRKYQRVKDTFKDIYVALPFPNFETQKAFKTRGAYNIIVLMIAQKLEKIQIPVNRGTY